MSTPARIKSPNNIFMNDAKPPTKDQGVMNLGKHCEFCQQLDFLPFHCEYCQKDYCSQHRTLESHKCVKKLGDEVKHVHRNYGGPTASSLFPDREKDKAKINQIIENSKPKPTNILQSQFKVGDVAAKTPNAFNKFKKFLNLQKNNKSKSSITKLFNTSSKTKTNPIVEISKLRKSAKGDIKVKADDRVYVWGLFVNGNDSDLSSINVETDKKPLYVSKLWPVGRALDSIAETLKISNYNNSTLNSEERLNIFLNKNEEIKLVQNSDRVNKAFKNGDVIYLVKGSIEGSE